MRQEINLYVEELRPRVILLSSLTLVAICAALLFLLLSWHLLSWYQVVQLRSQVEALSGQKSDLENQVSSLRAQRPRSQGAQLLAQIDALAGEVKRREKIKELIAGQNLGNSKGFSHQMRGLARQRVADVSLGGFKLLEGGRILELEGSTLRSASVPLYIERLKREPGFGQVKFGTLLIERQVGRSSLEFSLQRVALDESK